MRFEEINFGVKRAITYKRQPFVRLFDSFPPLFHKHQKRSFSLQFYNRLSTSASLLDLIEILERLLPIVSDEIIEREYIPTKIQ